MKLKEGVKVYHGGVCYKGEIPAHVKKELGQKAKDLEHKPEPAQQTKEEKKANAKS